MIKLDATTGTQQAEFDAVANGCIGGDVWGSPTIDEATGKLYFVTGDYDGSPCTPPGKFVDAMVELNASDFSLVASWQVPYSQRVGDGDFGTTPTLFDVTVNGQVRHMVGAGNKNGLYYAFNRTNIAAGPIWKLQVAFGSGDPTVAGTVSSSAWDGTTLYVAGGKTQYGSGPACAGSVRAVNPITGHVLWKTCMSNPVLASLTAIPGVVFAGAYTNFYALSATNGQILWYYHDASNNTPRFWSPTTVDNGVVYEGNTDGSLYAFTTH
jgi:polyvinyl alcohol dehydrogenase (cytochrome)